MGTLELRPGDTAQVGGATILLAHASRDRVKLRVIGDDEDAADTIWGKVPLPRERGLVLVRSCPPPERPHP